MKRRQFTRMPAVLLALLLVFSATLPVAAETEGYLYFELGNSSEYTLTYAFYADADFNGADAVLSGSLEANDVATQELSAAAFESGTIGLLLEDSRGYWARYAFSVEYEIMLGSATTLVVCTDNDDMLQLLDGDETLVEPLDTGAPENEETPEDASDLYADTDTKPKSANPYYKKAKLRIVNYLDDVIDQVYVKPSSDTEWGGNMLKSGTVIPVGSTRTCHGTINYHKNTKWDIYIYTQNGGWFKSRTMSFADVSDPYCITIAVYRLTDGTYTRDIY